VQRNQTSSDAQSKSVKGAANDTNQTQAIAPAKVESKTIALKNVSATLA